MSRQQQAALAVWPGKVLKTAIGPRDGGAPPGAKWDSSDE